MRRVRTLVVDDSAAVRRLVSDVLASDPRFDTPGVAPNGRIALEKIIHARPDAVVLDVEMPEMDGLATLAAIRREHPRLPVVMFSASTVRGAKTTLDALFLGANDYATKPFDASSADDARRRVCEDLLPKLLALADHEPIPPPEIARAAVPAEVVPVEVVVIGASTGGPVALSAVLAAVPRDVSTPMAIVQHMPPLFTRLLAESLSSQTGRHVREARDGDRLRAGEVLVAPGDHHLELDGGDGEAIARLHQGPPENSSRPAVDVLFRSAAAACGPGVLAAVLTGMGQDGLRGAEVIREAGGRVLAQDEASSVVWGMPRFVAQAGLAERVLPLELIGIEIGRIVREARR